MRLYYLIYLFCPYLLTAQAGFINVYNLDSPGAVFSDMLLNEDTLIVCGLIIPDEPPYSQGVFFAKLDTLGNLISFKSYFDSLGHDYVLGDFPSGLIQLQDHSGYLLLGVILQGSEGVLMKLDNDGDLIWIKQYPDSQTSTDFYFKIVEVGNGFLIGGYKQAVGSGDINIFVKKINKQGEQIWEKLFGKNNFRNDYLGSLLVLDNNEYILGGTTGAPAGTPWQEYSSTTKIIAIDSLGIEKWRWENEPTLEELWIRGLHYNNDGNWIYSTVKGEYEFDGFLKRQPKFIKRNSDFEIVEEKVLDDIDGNGNYLLDVVALSDGGWFGIGANHEEVTNPILAEAHRFAWMIRMDENGDTLWQRKDLAFPDTLFATAQFLHSAVELPSGSIIAAGYYSSLPDPKVWGILIKVDENGCIDTINCTPIISATPEVPTKEEVTVYPNPASSMVYFDQSEINFWDKIELFDLTGKKIKEIQFSNNLKINELNNGVYIVRLLKSGNYSVKRIVKK